MSDQFLVEVITIDLKSKELLPTIINLHPKIIKRVVDQGDNYSTYIEYIDSSYTLIAHEYIIVRSLIYSHVNKTFKEDVDHVIKHTWKDKLK